jgi:hypothetical protein
MKVRRVEKIPAPLQPLGRDSRPDRLVSVQGGLGQIEKPQAHPEEKNGNPNQAERRERHINSLWLLDEMVKVFKKSSTVGGVALCSTPAGPCTASCGFLQHQVCNGILPA